MNKKFWQHFTIITVVLILAFMLSSCERIKSAYGKRRGGDAVEMPVPVFAVATVNASRGSISDHITFSGDVVPASSVDAFSDAAGRVSRLYVSVGSSVRRNDPIADVDASRPGMDFVASVVRAPVAGTIVALPAQLGMTVNQAVPIARIAGGSGLEIRLHIAERFISRISIGQNCEIYLDAWPGEVFRGRISQTNPVLDPVSRTMEIRITFDDPLQRIKAGMFARVRIITQTRNNTVRIPASALIQRFGEDYVFIAEIEEDDDDEDKIDNENGENPVRYIAKKRTVVPGIHIDGILEIVQGLNHGDDVVIRGHSLLEDGARINIVERAASISN